MDEDRFDELVRRFGQSSRRGVLGVVLGALFVDGAFLFDVAAKNRRRHQRKGKARQKQRPTHDRRSQSGVAEPAAETRDVELRASPRPGSLVIDYFALGDSIAAGHGLGDTGNGRDPGWCEPNPKANPPCCRRSRLAHPFKLKDRLAARNIVVDGQLKHLACSGAKVDDLERQINVVEDFIRDPDRPARPVLVTVSIGGNDTGATDLKFAFDLLYRMTTSQYDSWLLGKKTNLSLDLQRALERLLKLPDIVVVVNELINPLNEESIFFEPGLSGRDRTYCQSPNWPFETYPCARRVNRIIDMLNVAFREQVAQLADRYPGRIVMTQGMKDEFTKYWGAPGVEEIQVCDTGGRPGLPPICRKEPRPDCGYKNSAAIETCLRSGGTDRECQKTWIQSRTSRQSNSFPMRSTSLWGRVLNYLLPTVAGRPTDWQGDCVHPNDDGQAAIARHLDQAISRVNWNAVRRCGDGPPCAQGETCVAGACVGGEEYRIVLTWGEEPRDLDSHLWLPVATPYEVYYADRGQLDAFPYAELDIDDTTSFGPETITISRLQPGDYTYAVHLYSGAGTIGTSGAMVRLFRGGTLVKTYNPPSGGPWSEDDGPYVWWHVFTLHSDGTITDVNESSAYPSPYLESGAFVGEASARALPPKTKVNGRSHRQNKHNQRARRRKRHAHR